LASDKSCPSMVWPIPNIDGTDRARPAMGDSGLGEQTLFFGSATGGGGGAHSDLPYPQVRG
jgi:hypothetical protein